LRKGTNLFRSLPKYKQHSINDITLSTSIRSNHSRKLCNKNFPKFQLHKLNDSKKWKNPINNLMKGAITLFASVRFEVPHHHLFDEKPRWRLRFHWCGRVRVCLGIFVFAFLCSYIKLKWIVVIRWIGFEKKWLFRSGNGNARWERVQILNFECIYTTGLRVPLVEVRSPSPLRLLIILFF